MTVDDPACSDSINEQHRAAGNETHCAPFYFGDNTGVQAWDPTLGVISQLGETRLPPRSDRLEAAFLVDLTATMRLGVEPGQHRRYRHKLFVDLHALAHQRGQPALIGMAPHHDHRFGLSAVGETDVRNPQIAGRSQPAVEHDLSRAGPFATLRCRKVEEIGGDGLLDFVGPITDEEYQAGVRLNDVVHR